MIKQFTCPSEFNLEQATTFIISKNYREEIIYGDSNISVLSLNNESPKYFSAQGKLWKERNFPNELIFEEVDCIAAGENNRRHFHTQFHFGGHVVHIDYVVVWSYGPYIAQHCVKIFEDQRLKSTAISGGTSLGANWARGWPATLVTDTFLIRFNGGFKSYNQRLNFKAGEADFPFIFCVPVSEDVPPFRIFDFGDLEFVKNKLIPAIDVSDISHPFIIKEGNKLDFINRILKRLQGHYLSKEALQNEIKNEFSLTFNGLYTSNWKLEIEQMNFIQKLQEKFTSNQIFEDKIKARKGRIYPLSRENLERIRRLSPAAKMYHRNGKENKTENRSFLFMGSSYYTYKNREYQCTKCGWIGFGDETNQGETSNEGFEIHCPKCHERIPGLILFPTIAETFAHGSEADKRAASVVMAYREKWRASLLTDISQLPDLNDSFMAFILRETQKGDEKFIEITHKGKLIWKEVLAYEYFERFIELGKIFKIKYGSRMIDLVPDVDGDYLYGDRIDARKKIEDFRRGLRFE